MMCRPEITALAAERTPGVSGRTGSFVVLLAAMGLLNLAMVGATLCGWPAMLVDVDVNWLITFDLMDGYVQRTFWSTALACAQVGLLALWCGSASRGSTPRWLALGSGIAAWSVLLQFLHPAVARADESRAIFSVQAMVILLAMFGLRLVSAKPVEPGANGWSRQWTIRNLLWITAVIGLALASSSLTQPNKYSTPVTWTFSYWRVAVAMACAAIALAAFWASRRPWPRALAASVVFALVGATLAFSFSRVPLLWPPAHNPGEAHYPAVFWPFCRAYTLWAVVQGHFVLSVLVAATIAKNVSLWENSH